MQLAMPKLMATRSVSSLSRTSLIELSQSVLQRALEPLTRPVRTLDALHLASIHFLTEQRLRPGLATYDQRLAETAHAMGIELFDLEQRKRQEVVRRRAGWLAAGGGTRLGTWVGARARASAACRARAP